MQEINIPELESISKSRRTVRNNIEEFLLDDGRKLYLLGEGRLVNLACGDGHPAEIMDLSFAVQLLSAKHILENKGKLDNDVYVISEEIDAEIAKIKLKAIGVEIDELTAEQREYLAMP